MRILIAEDDELILKTVEHKLLKEGYEVLISRNGKEATDIMMPFASGIEMLSALKNLKKQIPVIMLSSMGQEDVILEAFQMGAADFMVKPFSPNELILRIKRLLNN